MPTVFIFAATAMGLVVTALVIIGIGTRQEPSAQELTRQPPRLMARLARRLLGVYVCRPAGSASDPGKQRGEPSHTAHHPARRLDGRTLARMRDI
jgi:hypothetical protein